MLQGNDPGRDRTAAIWDIESGKKLQTFEGHTRTVRQAIFSPDGKKIVTASQDNTAKIWDAESGKELQTLEGHTSFVNYVAFSPDGKRIATASTDNTVRIWDVESGEELKRFDRLPGRMRWNYDTGEEVKDERLSNPRSVAFSPDGKRLLAGSVARVAVIWDVESGEELRRLGGFTSVVNSVAFSPDGKKIATGSIGDAHIWDAETGEKLHTIGHHGNEIAGLPRRLTRGAPPGISFVAFSPDGKRIVTGSTDATARIWTLE